MWRLPTHSADSAEWMGHPAQGDREGDPEGSKFSDKSALKFERSGLWKTRVKHKERSIISEKSLK
jgi:hypothetical protein